MPRLARRDMLKIGCLAPSGIWLPFFHQVASSASLAPRPRGIRSCILLWLDGGPSHLETWDPKPDAPDEVRGPLGTIGTSLPGVRLGECLPECAKLMHELVLLRSLTSPLGEHGLANHYWLTGRRPNPAVAYPSLASIVSHYSPKVTLPSYMVIHEVRQGMGQGFLDHTDAPFEIRRDSKSGRYGVADLEPFPAIDLERLQRRQHLLQDLDRSLKPSDAEDRKDLDRYGSAFQMVMSKEARDAFDLDRESPTTLERYGDRPLGQGCLLARRLIERGVRFVTITHTGWDTHDQLKLQLRDGYSGAKVGVGLIPTLDRALSALILDLKQRELLDQTLILVMGEFGRTPKINPRGGRDHWPRVFSAVMAGGGIRGGQVIGASDRTGESPMDLPVSPVDLTCTLLHLFGIEPHRELVTPDGRPLRLAEEGTVLSQLLT
ncbi:MAG: DUF1501 domain-containing protein [Pirellulales bacterium]